VFFFLVYIVPSHRTCRACHGFQAVYRVHLQIRWEATKADIWSDGLEHKLELEEKCKRAEGKIRPASDL
jgi:hypothetical protein